jgi:hypothetical protein
MVLQPHSLGIYHRGLWVDTIDPECQRSRKPRGRERREGCPCTLFGPVVLIVGMMKALKKMFLLFVGPKLPDGVSCKKFERTTTNQSWEKKKKGGSF